MRDFCWTKKTTLHDFLVLLFFNKEVNQEGVTTQIKLTQTGLIKRILAVTGIEECASMSNPAELKALAKDEQGDPPMEKWSYASIVGMLMYLASNS